MSPRLRAVRAGGFLCIPRRRRPREGVPADARANEQSVGDDDGGLTTLDVANLKGAAAANRVLATRQDTITNVISWVSIKMLWSGTIEHTRWLGCRSSCQCWPKW